FIAFVLPDLLDDQRDVLAVQTEIPLRQELDPLVSVAYPKPILKVIGVRLSFGQLNEVPLLKLLHTFQHIRIRKERTRLLETQDVFVQLVYKFSGMQLCRSMDRFEHIAVFLI